MSFNFRKIELSIQCKKTKNQLCITCFCIKYAIIQVFKFFHIFENLIMRHFSFYGHQGRTCMCTHSYMYMLYLCMGACKLLKSQLLENQHVNYDSIKSNMQVGTMIVQNHSNKTCKRNLIKTPRQVNKQQKFHNTSISMVGHF